MIVLDASAVLELLLRTAKGQKVEARTLSSDEPLHAPELMDIEVAQTLRRLTLLKQISASRGADALDDCRALLIRRTSHRELLGRIWELKDSLSAYDATYVALAEALDAPLLTCDSRLARSHGHGAMIECVS